MLRRLPGVCTRQCISCRFSLGFRRIGIYTGILLALSLRIDELWVTNLHGIFRSSQMNADIAIPAECILDLVAQSISLRQFIDNDGCQSKYFILRLQKLSDSIRHCILVLTDFAKDASARVHKHFTEQLTKP